MEQLNLSTLAPILCYVLLKLFTACNNSKGSKLYCTNLQSSQTARGKLGGCELVEAIHIAWV